MKKIFKIVFMGYEHNEYRQLEILVSAKDEEQAKSYGDFRKEMILKYHLGFDSLFGVIVSEPHICILDDEINY